MLLRIGRLWPLHIAILVLFFASQATKYIFNHSMAFNTPAFALWKPGYVVGNILLMPELCFTNEKAIINPPTWSIAAEFFAYFIFAILCVANGLRARYLAIFVVIATVVGLILYPYSKFGVNDLMRCTVGFAIGCLCARAISLYRKSSIPLEPKRRWLWTLIEATCVLGLALFVSTAGGTRKEVLAAFVFAAPVLVYALELGALSAALKAPWVVWLGTLSYSIYLTHWFLMDKVISVGNMERLFHRKLSISVLENGVPVSRFGVNSVQGTLYYFEVMAATLMFSAITYRFIEEPARLWVRARTRGMN